MKSMSVPNTVPTRTFSELEPVGEPHVICLLAPTSGKKQYGQSQPGRWLDSVQPVCVNAFNI